MRKYMSEQMELDFTKKYDKYRKKFKRDNRDISKADIYRGKMALYYGLIQEGGTIEDIQGFMNDAYTAANTSLDEAPLGVKDPKVLERKLENIIKTITTISEYYAGNYVQTVSLKDKVIKKSAEYEAITEMVKKMEKDLTNFTDSYLKLVEAFVKVAVKDVQSKTDLTHVNLDALEAIIGENLGSTDKDKILENNGKMDVAKLQNIIQFVEAVASMVKNQDPTSSFYAVASISKAADVVDKLKGYVSTKNFNDYLIKKLKSLKDGGKAWKKYLGENSITITL